MQFAFERFVSDTIRLLEAEAPVAAPQEATPAPTTPAPDAAVPPIDGAEQGAAQPQPQESKPVSQKYAFLVSMIYDLLKYTKELPGKYKRYSDKVVDTPAQVVPYITMLSELLPQDAKQQLHSISFTGKGGDPNEDMDEMTMVDFVNTALRATFYTEKNTPDFSRFLQDLRALTGGKISPENAERVYNRISNFLAIEKSDTAEETV